MYSHMQYQNIYFHLVKILVIHTAYHKTYIDLYQIVHLHYNLSVTASFVPYVTGIYAPNDLNSVGQHRVMMTSC